jgi:3-isopropylmalate/(R)-2-methylmalate dehydratase small subunit
VLPIRLSSTRVDSLLRQLRDNPDAMIKVDLTSQTVHAAGTTDEFDIDPFAKHCLLNGLDQIDYTLSLLADIEAYEQRTAS